VSNPYRDLIASSRVSTPTRQALAERAVPDDPGYIPQALDAASLATLRALLGRIIPQTPPHDIDLAARIDQQLARDVGDGWRFAALPSDPVAYRRGLRTLDVQATNHFGAPFARLIASRQDDLLSMAAAGDRDGEGKEHPWSQATGMDEELNGSQLRAWFEEVRADAVRLYVAHPNTLARVGYSGIANGGDGLPKSGFVRVGLGEREEWEPLPSPPADP
jgi:hypothetical protein